MAMSIREVTLRCVAGATPDTIVAVGGKPDNTFSAIGFNESGHGRITSVVQRLEDCYR